MSVYRHFFAFFNFRIILWSVLIALTFFSHRASAQDFSQVELQTGIRQAVEFLLELEGKVTGAANEDYTPGVWGYGDSSLHVTASVVAALWQAKKSDLYDDDPQTRSRINSAINRANLALVRQEFDSVERQALAASIRVRSQQGIGEYRNLILNQQQADGGWGITIEHRSSVRDTTMIVDALLTDGLMEISQDRLIGVASFLKGELVPQADEFQVSIGSAWRHGIGGTSAVSATARGLTSLRSVGKLLGSESAIYDQVESSMEFLISQVEPSVVIWPGSAGSSLYDTETIASVLRAYAGLRQPGELEPMVGGVLSSKIEYVPDAVYWTNSGLGVNEGNTVYADHFYTTAMVVRALLELPSLNEATELPDLRINLIDLSSSGVLDNTNLSFAGSAGDFIVENTNSISFGSEGTIDNVSELRIQFFEGDPRRNTIVDGHIVRTQPVGGIMALDLPLPTSGIVNLENDLGLTELPILGIEFSQPILGAVIDYDHRIPEMDETNNVYAVAIDSGADLAGQNGADIAVVAHSLSVSHTNLLEQPVVQLSVSLWNAGNSAIDTGSRFRIWFRAAPYDASYSNPSEGVEIFDFSDSTLIDYIDIELTGGLASLAQSGPYTVDWIPTRSPSRTVTVQVQSLEASPVPGYQDADFLNNADEQAFVFETGQLNMSHVRAANGDLLFFLEYGDYCNSALHGFAAYSRQSSGDVWQEIGNASNGPGGTVSPCSFLIPRAQAWGMTAGTYQSLGEVWTLVPNSDERRFIDDAILQFTVPPFTDITGFAASFEGVSGSIDPTGFPDVAHVYQFENVHISLYYLSNLGTSPVISISYELFRVNDDELIPFDLPITGTASSATDSTQAGVLKYVFPLPDDSLGSPGLQALESDTSYAVVATIEGDADGASPMERRYVFTIGQTDGYVLHPKKLYYNGAEVTGPINAQDGDKITVQIPIQKVEASQ